MSATKTHQPRAGAATGIGSLPHRDPAAALAFVAETTPELPYWPQLPNRHPFEGMVAQTLGPLRGLEGDQLAVAVADPALEPTLDEGRAAAWEPFLRDFPTRFPRARAVKGQLTGPLTLAHGVLERARGAAIRVALVCLEDVALDRHRPPPAPTVSHSPADGRRSST